MPRPRNSDRIVSRPRIGLNIAAPARLKTAAPAFPIFFVLRVQLLVADWTISQIGAVTGRSGAAITITLPEIWILLQR